MKLREIREFDILYNVGMYSGKYFIKNKKG